MSVAAAEKDSSLRPVGARVRRDTFRPSIVFRTSRSRPDTLLGGGWCVRVMLCDRRVFCGRLFAGAHHTHPASAARARLNEDSPGAKAFGRRPQRRGVTENRSRGRHGGTASSAGGSQRLGGARGLSLSSYSKMSSHSSDEFFQAMNHAEQTFRKMENYLQHKQLCDVLLIAGDHKIPAHRLVLSAVSDYFAAMFTNDVREAKQEEIKMEGVDPEALRSLVHYAYTGVLELKEETIESLLAAACLLQLSQVIEVCCNFLMKQLHPSNCLGIRSFADAQGCVELLNVAHSYTMQPMRSWLIPSLTPSLIDPLQEHFLEVIQNQEFLLLPTTEIVKLLASDDINVPDEETIFQALMMWVRQDVQQRQQDLGLLLSYIRLPLLPPQLLADLENNKMFSEDLECQKLLMEAMKYHLLPERRPMLQSPRTKPRKSTVGALYAVGGMDATKGPVHAESCLSHDMLAPQLPVLCSSPGSTTIEKYDLRTNTWIQVGVMNGRRLQFGVAVIDNKLYVVGGRDGLKTSNMVECYSPVTKGPMYAVGGHDGWSYLNTVERWDPQARQWNYVASMSTPRSTVGVTALNGKLFAVGGRDGSSCLRSMECFDPHTNKWSMCAPMSKRRGGVGVATYNGFLYAVGGHDAPASNHCSRLSDCVERYDPKTDTWTTVAPLSVPRDAVGVCLLGDRLYAVGGYDGQTYLNTVESYDAQNNEWTELLNRVEVKRLMGNTGQTETTRRHRVDGSTDVTSAPPSPVLVLPCVATPAVAPAVDVPRFSLEELRKHALSSVFPHVASCFFHHPLPTGPSLASSPFYRPDEGSFSASVSWISSKPPQNG
ncbi:kelch-like protein 4-like [Scleropages formosus]|uniref:Kelch-like protein 4-like n=1 Tax=Scleropages formosus TaxID=113540 RepID=A0A0P7TN69_SCLFO|nr:kelch-like protein 4-like [Scleropages formosus]